MWPCVCVHTRVCVWVCMHVCVYVCMRACTIACACMCPIDYTITHMVTFSSKVPNHENSDRIHEARAPSWLDGFCALHQFSFLQGTFCRPTRIHTYMHIILYMYIRTD